MRKISHLWWLILFILFTSEGTYDTMCELKCHTYSERMNVGRKGGGGSAYSQFMRGARAGQRLISQRYADEVRAAREEQESSNPRTSDQFGNGEVGGDNRWTAPVYGTTDAGEDVTVSFGQEGRTGHTGITDGHVTGEQYYGASGHDHYGSSGEAHGDRGAFRRQA
jgi:hypothetical protein